MSIVDRLRNPFGSTTPAPEGMTEHGTFAPVWVATPEGIQRVVPAPAGMTEHGTFEAPTARMRDPGEDPDGTLHAAHTAAAERAMHAPQFARELHASTGMTTDGASVPMPDFRVRDDFHRLEGLHPVEPWRDRYVPIQAGPRYVTMQAGPRYRWDAYRRRYEVVREEELRPGHGYERGDYPPPPSPENPRLIASQTALDLHAAMPAVNDLTKSQWDELCSVLSRTLSQMFEDIGVAVDMSYYKDTSVLTDGDVYSRPTLRVYARRTANYTMGVDPARDTDADLSAPHMTETFREWPRLYNMRAEENTNAGPR